jgi:NAD(P)-dependent dehydrogenase (short-subunit alcohol dehydrogenase family)
MARVFAEQGMRLALADINGGQLEQVKQQLLEAGHEVLVFPLDVCNRAALQAAITSTVKHFGALHVVCANAGVAGFIGPLQTACDSDWDWIVDVNLKGAINTVQAALPHLMQNPRDAHIVLTSSISGLRVYEPSRGQGMYNTTKFALVGFGEALHADLHGKGVGVSILCPGVVNTDISNSGRNRPTQYGGPIDVHQDFVLAKAAKHGTDPVDYGRWVLKAMKCNQLYVITHTEDRAMVEARHARIMQAFDDSASLTGN